MFFKKNWPYIFMFSTFLLVIGMFLFRQYAMLDTSETCAKVTQEIIIKGHHSFELSFFVGREKKYGQVSSRALKVIDFKELKKYDCIKIKYSNSFPSYIEIVDERVRAGSGW